MSHLLSESLLSHRVDPADALAFIPLATLDLASAIVIGAEAVLLSILPISIIFAVVWPSEDTMALLFIIDVHAFILAAITPSEDAESVHFVILPLSVVLTAVRPAVDTLSVNIVLEELTVVGGAVGPEELSMTVFLTVAVLTLVASIIRPDFFSVTMLLIFEPVALVASAISVVVLSVSMCLVVLPLAAVDITVSVNQATTSVSLISPPVTFIKRAIDPDLSAAAIFAAHLIPLAFILSAVLKLHHLSLHALHAIWSWAWLPFEVLQIGPDLHDKLARSLDFVLSLRIVGSREGVPSLETVRLLNLSARQDSSNEALHSQDSEFLLSLWIVIRVFTSCKLRLL